MNTEKRPPLRSDLVTRPNGILTDIKDMGVTMSLVRELKGVMRVKSKRRFQAFKEIVRNSEGQEIPIVDLRKRLKRKQRSKPQLAVLLLVDFQLQTFGFIVYTGKEISRSMLKLNSKSLHEEDRLFVRAKRGEFVLKVDDILCVRNERRYVAVYLSSGSKIIANDSMGQWEKHLPSSIFLRIHNSTIININYVEKLEKVQERWKVVCMKNSNGCFTVSQRRFNKIKSRFLV